MKKKLVAMLLCAAMAVTMVPSTGMVAFAEEIGGEETADNAWTAADFTFGESEVTITTRSSTDKLTESIYVVTGFSEEGKEKLTTNSEVVIPATDADGKEVHGIGKNAFAGTSSISGGITSVTFPENVMVDWDKSFSQESAVAGLEKRGDFYIGYGAFRYNDIENLTLPEGVFVVDTYAFANNKLKEVTLPRTLKNILSGAFAGNNKNTANQITKVTFAKETDFGMEIDMQAFAFNQLKAVVLPSNVDSLSAYAFMSNQYVSSTNFGVVDLYKVGDITGERLGYIGHNNTFDNATINKNNKYQTLTSVSEKAAAIIEKDPTASNIADIVDQDKAIAEKDATIADQAQEIADQAQEIADKAQTITDQAQQIADQAQTITDQAQEIADKAQTITDQAQQIADQAQEIADGKTASDAKVSELETKLADLEKQLADEKEKAAFAKVKASVTATAGKKKVKAAWKSVANAEGYQISVSKKASATKVVKTTTALKYTKKSLKAKKNYYVKVRAYKTIGGEKVYSAWSSAKKVKTK